LLNAAADVDVSDAPAAKVVRIAEVVALVVTVDVITLHESDDVAPGAVENFPAGQAIQEEAPAAEYRPG
jgi:hypothetical protein